MSAATNSALWNAVETLLVAWAKELRGWLREHTAEEHSE